MVSEVSEKKKTKNRGQLQEIWIRLKKSKQAMVGLTLLSLIIIVTIMAGILVDYDGTVIKQNIVNRLQPTSREHILGTDAYGRDILARLLYGARISLVIGMPFPLSLVDMYMMLFIAIQFLLEYAQAFVP